MAIFFGRVVAQAIVDLRTASDRTHACTATQEVLKLLYNSSVCVRHHGGLKNLSRNQPCNTFIVLWWQHWL